MPDLILSAEQYDPEGYLELDVFGLQGIGDRERRLTRTETIDGGVVIEGGAAPHADRIWEITAALSADQRRRLLYMLEVCDTLTCTTAEGLFTVKLQSVRAQGGLSRLTLWVTARRR
jgi:hypothetical protein